MVMKAWKLAAVAVTNPELFCRRCFPLLAILAEGSADCVCADNAGEEKREQVGTTRYVATTTVDSEEL
ncbi:unnamed protein product [Sphagnum tenellum]